MPTINDDGLLLGATVLIPMQRDACGNSTLSFDDVEERVLALLAIVYGETAGLRSLDRLRRAAKYWGEGERHLAAIEIALSGLPPLSDPEEASFRLFAGEQLLANGTSPCELIELCGGVPRPHDTLKAGYNPDQPRVPAGSPGAGQWTSEGSAPNRSILIPSGYTHVHELPSDAKVVVPPDGIPIPDEDSPTKLLMAPPRADFRVIYAAGQSIASLPLSEQYAPARAAIAQAGTYDFQRDVRHQKFIDHYVHAANYAAGVYMAGAGYSLETTLALAKLYALRHSSNYDSQDQMGWIKRGWTNAVAGRWR